MRSIKEIFVIGYGPSSSHTMGPAKACDYILKSYKDIDNIAVFLYGSLACTGKGHLTDYIIDLKLKNINHTITFDKETKTKHPNTILFRITNKKGEIFNEKILSIGGGTIVTKDNYNDVENEIFPHKNLSDILLFCDEKKIALCDYVKMYEKDDISTYITNCIESIIKAIERGKKATGVLPGELKVKRKANFLSKNSNKSIDDEMISSAFAVAEENASGGEIVISPTCGSAGVFGGIVSYFMQNNYSLNKMIDCMLVAGLIGILAKTNASVSGAEAGCQAEIGVACAMGAAAIANGENLTNRQIAQAAEIALEHSLGLTCDPVNGYVQIPCIERCAIYSLKAKNAVSLVKLLPVEDNKITFDKSLKTMYSTGKDLQAGYKETSEKGLSENY